MGKQQHNWQNWSGPFMLWLATVLTAQALLKVEGSTFPHLKWEWVCVCVYGCLTPCISSSGWFLDCNSSEMEVVVWSITRTLSMSRAPLSLQCPVETRVKCTDTHSSVLCVHGCARASLCVHHICTTAGIVTLDTWATGPMLLIWGVPSPIPVLVHFWGTFPIAPVLLLPSWGPLGEAFLFWAHTRSPATPSTTSLAETPRTEPHLESCLLPRAPPVFLLCSPSSLGTHATTKALHICPCVVQWPVVIKGAPSENEARVKHKASVSLSEHCMDNFDSEWWNMCCNWIHFIVDGY